MSKKIALTLVLSLAAAACQVRPGGPSVRTSGVDLANFDTSVKPGDNFFEYVNGAWIKANPIPGESSSWGAFNKLRDDNLFALHDILESLAKSHSHLDDNRRKLRDFYLTAMDEEKLNREGATPLAGEFDEIAAIHSRDELLVRLGEFRGQGLNFLFNFSVGQDEKQSDHYAVHLHQGGLGLPEREYYLGDTDDSKRIRAAYHDHVAKMLELLGDAEDRAAAEADTVLAFETQLAQASRTPTQLRDAIANYNKKSYGELAALTPNLNWPAYLAPTGVPDFSQVIVGQPEFFTRVNDMLASVALGDWKTYLRWQLIHAASACLSSDFEKENFHFYSEILRGVKEMQPRWKRAVAAIDGHMGEALGKLYVDKYFPPEAKKRMDQMVKNLLAAYHDRIENVTWMGAETKQKALEKLAAINPKIGYPAKWRDYSALEIRSDSYIQNILRSQAFESRYRFARLNGPVDRNEWHMTPPTVNAYYNESMNEIVFPAGILQPPFFNTNADDAVNYGGIGAVIGHEITHGFDDQGSRADAHGNLNNWWTAEDRERFNAKTEMLAKEFDACVPIDDVHINGHLTLGENLADLGGITISYHAYQNSLHGQAAPVLDGFTGDQRFFIGFAQIWRGSIRDAALRLQLRTDPHSPAQFRTLVPLSNFQPFYDAFNVQAGDKMYRDPAERVVVW